MTAKAMNANRELVRALTFVAHEGLQLDGVIAVRAGRTSSSCSRLLAQNYPQAILMWWFQHRPDDYVFHEHDPGLTLDLHRLVSTTGCHGTTSQGICWI